MSLEPVERRRHRPEPRNTRAEAEAGSVLTREPVQVVAVRQDRTETDRTEVSVALATLSVELAAVATAADRRQPVARHRLETVGQAERRQTGLLAVLAEPVQVCRQQMAQQDQTALVAAEGLARVRRLLLPVQAVLVALGLSGPLTDQAAAVVAAAVPRTHHRRPETAETVACTAVVAVVADGSRTFYRPVGPALKV